MEILIDAPRVLSRKSAFEAQFSRTRNTLYLVAYRLLGDPTRARQVVDHCWTISSQRRPMFESEWLGEARCVMIAMIQVKDQTIS